MARADSNVLQRALLPQIVLNNMIREALNTPSVECIRVMGEIHELSNKTGLSAGEKDYGHYDYSDLCEPLSEDAWKIQFETKDILFLEALIRKYPDCELTSYQTYISFRSNI